MPFKPGQSGNPTGAKPRPFREALMMEFASADDPVDVPARSLRAVARRMIDDALAGGAVQQKEIADRIDGKVPQAHIGGDDGDQPIRSELAVMTRGAVDEIVSRFASRAKPKLNGKDNGVTAH